VPQFNDRLKFQPDGHSLFPLDRLEIKAYTEIHEPGKTIYENHICLAWLGR
jgi:hypothetical protein